MDTSLTYPDLQLRFEHQRLNRWRFLSEEPQKRVERLGRLKKVIIQKQTQIQEALFSDFSKSPFETELTEIFPVLEEIKMAMESLERWARPKSVETPVTLMGTESYVKYEPKGVVLILSPWNYPFQLAIAPLIAALAAGNAVILKPSEKSPATSQVIFDLISEALTSDETICILGDASIAEALLRLPFDHIFFTGSTRIGKKVMMAAAEHVASVTLELGGKSPAIIDAKISLSAIAKRLAWAKFMNAGQTCVAPDYVLIPSSRVTDFASALKTAVDQLYTATLSADYCSMIDEASLRRMTALVEDATAQGAKVVWGGSPVNGHGKFGFAPTLMVDVPPACRLMQEEIFGPILPVIAYDRIEEALEFVRGRDKPLALYIFSYSEEFKSRVLRETTSGGVVVNNAVIHVANPFLPFGGVGASGVGNYHGEYGFRTFSHERAVMEQSRFNILEFLYPPYPVKKWIFAILRRIYA